MGLGLDVCTLSGGPLKKIVPEHSWDQIRLGPDGDVTKMDFESLMVPDGLQSGPPCQGMAKNGTRGGFADKRTSVWLAIVGMVINFMNRGMCWFSIEMVAAAMESQEGAEPIAEVMKRLLVDAIGSDAKVWIWVLYCSDYNIPQDRTRMWLCGCRNELCRYNKHGVFGHGFLPPPWPDPADLGFSAVPAKLSTILGTFPDKWPTTSLQKGALASRGVLSLSFAHHTFWIFWKQELNLISAVWEACLFGVA
jgi:site-specific DNA-cytosine methylase